jgi:hypothetical protein
MKRILEIINNSIQKYKNLTFWLLLISISFFYQYQRILVLRPQSIHMWRQADCASQALNYYQNSMNFFKPEIHYRVADNGTSGCCAEEFPLIFYITACFYKLLGPHEWIFRIITIIIFFFGLFALFKICFKLYNDIAISAFVGGLLFLSPVFVFYANNFTTNTSSFAIALVGWYFFFNFLTNSRIRNLYISLAFFTLASLLKLSEAMSLIAVTGIYLLETMNIININRNKRIFSHRILHIMPIILSFIVIAFWYFYANYYNKIHNQIYYAFTIHPIWQLDSVQIKNTWLDIRDRWFPDYFHVSIFILILASFIGNIVLLKRSNKLLMLITLILFLGSILYLTLWYNNLRNHDYYVISIYIFFIFSILTFIDILSRHYRKILTSLGLKLALLLLVLLNMILTRNNFMNRYKGWQNDIELYKDVQTVTPFLRLMGISRYDKVICFPDPTINYSLYLMNQPGWTSFYDYDNNVHMNAFLSLGAKYLILVGDVILTKPFLKSYMYHPVGKYGNVSIFKLDSIADDKDIKEPYAFKGNGEITCDAETVSTDKQYFIGSNKSMFECRNTQTDEKAHSGKYSAKIDKEHPFTMDFLLASVKSGDRYKISIWRYPKGAKSIIAACIKSSTTFYKTDYKSEKIDENGWELIKLEFDVPYELDNEKMGVYPSYNGNDIGKCYFDDLRIQHYSKNMIVK